MPPMAFCKHPHLNQPARQADLAEKNTTRSAAEVWRFFSSQPAGPGLDGLDRRSEICLRKSQWRKTRKAKRKLEQQAVGSLPARDEHGCELQRVSRAQARRAVCPNAAKRLSADEAAGAADLNH